MTMEEPAGTSPRAGSPSPPGSPVGAPERLRLLLVEDNEDDAVLLIRELRKGGVSPDYRRVDTLAEIEEALASDAWEVVISDYNLGTFTGIEALRLVQAKELDIPFILVSGAIGDEKAVEAMKAGVHDYIPKGNYARLVPAIERELRDVTQRRERRRAEAELEVYRKSLEELVRQRTSELERTNDELRRNQALVKTIVDATPDLVYLKDRNGRYLLFSPAAERFAGKSAEEVVGQDDTAILPPDEARVVMEEDREVVLTGEQKTYETILTAGDGTRRIFHTVKVPVRTGEGNVAILFGASRDVTDIRKAEAAVRASEERFRTTFEHAPVGIEILDLEGQILEANPWFSKILGYTQDEFRQLNFADITNKDDLAEELLLLHRLLAAELPTYAIEKRYIRKDGLHVWVRVTSSMSWTEQPYRISVVEDISERKRAEERLRQSEEQFRQLAEALPLLVWMTNPDGLIEYLNARWYEFTGWTAEESKGMKWAQLLHPDDEPDTMNRWDNSIRTGEQFEMEFRIRRGDGEYRWFLGRAVAVRNDAGDITRWFGTGTEIEEQKRAKDAAEEAVRAKSAFMANMSHEIRTPMNGILGVTDLLLDTEVTELQRQYLEMVKGSGEALLAVVNDVLDFSKLEAGAMVLDRTQFSLYDVVEKAAETLSIRAFQKGLEFPVLIEPELPEFFLGDPVKLRQVLLNLIGNAVKFTDAGEVAVHVSGSATEGKNWRLIFSVSDTGIGIPLEKQALIFKSFTQADTSTARSYGGTGLGLTISQRIVEQMGGRIQVESREGEGSTFSFDVELQQVERPTAEGPLFRELSGLRVLVLDDNRTNRIMLERALTSKGLLVEVAETGEDAVRMVLETADAGRPFDLVLLDQHLPDFDGFEVARRLRQRFPIDSLALMMITSDDVAGGARQARELGMEGYVVKPVRASVLLETLAKLRGAGKPATREEVQDGTLPGCALPFCTSVLVAEDNPVNLTVTETILRKAGARVTAATNGQEAVDLFFKGRFSVILMDVQMPEMDGLVATRHLRDMGVTVPIIGLTAHALQEDRERCLAAGMDDYIPKPVNAGTLTEKVRYWLEHHPAAPMSRNDLLRQMGDEESVDLLLQTARTSVPDQLAELMRVVEAGEAPPINRAAHRLKGALLAVKAETAACLAEELERAGRNGQLSEAHAVLHQLDAEIARLLKQIDEM